VNVDLTERVERIATDDRHGGSWLAKEAVEAVVEAARLGEDPVATARRIVAAKPGIGAIAGALGRLLLAGRTPEQLVEEANALITGRERAAAAIAVLLSQELAEKVVMTHSASATAREALLYAQPGRVVCTVSEPTGEGREFSEELAAAGLTTELVADEGAELTPPDQLDRIVTEEGEFVAEEISVLIDRTPFLNEGYELLRGERAPDRL
jgi:translation initiation factor 2B subunit (eIF-2B alpha/beta/delta family)